MSCSHHMLYADCFAVAAGSVASQVSMARHAVLSLHADCFAVAASNPV